MRLASGLGAIALLLAMAMPAAASTSMPARGSVQAAFTPGDDPGALISEVIRGAKRQVLVQAYSFTHKQIAEALVDARRRGVDVELIADHDQTYQIATSQVEQLARGGIPVWLDGEHAAAHDKVMIVDAGTPNAAVVTGSFNFTHAGQYRNAENVLILRGNPDLAAAYAANWRRHMNHAHPFRRRP